MVIPIARFIPGFRLIDGTDLNKVVDRVNAGAWAANPLNTALTTVGAGTLTAAAIVGGVITRSGPVGNFTDTTATAAQIIAAMLAPTIGSSFILTIINTTAFTETLAAGAGVTLSGIGAVVPPNSISQYLITMTGAATVSWVGIIQDVNISLPPAKFTTAAKAGPQTLNAGDITGADFVVLQNTGAAPGTQTVRTAAQMLADIPGAAVGLSYQFRIVNTGAGTLTLAADGGATVTLVGTATIATNVFRDYILTFTGAATATIQSIGAGTSP